MIAVPPRLNIPSNIPSNIQAISKQYPTASDYRISSSTWLPLYVLSHASPPSQSGTDAAAAGSPPDPDRAQNRDSGTGKPAQGVVGLRAARSRLEDTRPGVGRKGAMFPGGRVATPSRNEKKKIYPKCCNTKE